MQLKATTIVRALKADPNARKLLRHGRKERTIIEPRAAGLLPLKARLDVHNEARRQVVELKTTRDIATIRKTIADYKYLLSAAFYQRISRSKSVVFIFVETAEPYRVEIFKPTYEQLEQGRELMMIKLQQFDECWLENHWPEAPPTPEFEDDPLMMPIPFMTATPNRQRFELPVGELAL